MEDSTTPLGEFLRSRRAGIRPQDVGLTSYGIRRVPGLRREELAQLAGVSATYYTRLEQGQSTRASESVIDALARALGLSEVERAHLHDLARPAPGKPRRPARPAMVRKDIQQLIEVMDAVPAVVLGARQEVLAWNVLGHLLLAGHLDFDAPARPAQRPNLTKMLFLDWHHRDLYGDWNQAARCAVADLRMVAGRHKDDRELTDLIGELSLKSTEFASLWSKQQVANHSAATTTFRHPEVGELSLRVQTLLVPDESGHRVVMYTAAPASASAAAIELLRSRPEGTELPITGETPGPRVRR